MKIAGQAEKRVERILTLSALRRFELVDLQGRRARLDDLAIDLLHDDYPPVTRLVFRDAGKQLVTLPWNSVSEIDQQRRRIKVTALEVSQSADATLAREVLLCRDVLDALILDLQYRRATRANDLCLKEEGGRLLLWAADVGARAFLRRLSQGVIDAQPGDTLSDWKYIEFLRGEPEAARGGAGYYRRIERLPPGEIARLSETVPYLHAAELLALLALDPLADAGDGAYRVIESHLPALPVVAKDGRLLGEVMVSAAVSQIAPSNWGAQALRVFS